MKLTAPVLLLTMLLGTMSACTFIVTPEPTPSPLELTQALLFAGATQTRAVLETQVSDLLTQQAIASATLTEELPTATNTEIPPTFTPTLEPTATNTSVPPTATNTSVPPTATNTNIPPTQAPTAIPAVRLTFAPNGTNTSVMGTVAANQLMRYVFWAAEDQLIDVSLTTAQTASLRIASKSGIVLLDEDEGHQAYRGYLPASGDYYLEIHAGGDLVSFGLYLMIPERLTFEPGEIGMDFVDEVPKGGVHNYILYAFKDQEMVVEVYPDGKVSLSIWGVDGTVLLSGMGESNTFVGDLPLTQDWIINVRAIPGTGMQSYDFSITID